MKLHSKYGSVWSSICTGLYCCVIKLKALRHINITKIFRLPVRLPVILGSFSQVEGCFWFSSNQTMDYRLQAPIRIFTVTLLPVFYALWFLTTSRRIFWIFGVERRGIKRRGIGLSPTGHSRLFLKSCDLPKQCSRWVVRITKHVQMF